MSYRSGALWALLVLSSGWGLYRRQPLTVEAIAAKGLPSVVRVISPVSKDSVKVMAGFVVSKRGYILTAAHGITQKEVMVQFWGHDGWHKATVVHSSIAIDVAVLKVSEMPSDVPALKINSAQWYTPGAAIVMIGHPHLHWWWVSSGVVSRDVFGKIRVVQLAISVNQGNSGGPVLNSKGEVIGLVTETHGDGMGQAVPGLTLQALSHEFTD